MRYIAIFLLMLSPDLVQGCTCEFGCIKHYNDIVAVVEVLNPSDTYLGAFEAKVLRLKDRNVVAQIDKETTEATIQEDPGELITISDVGIHEKTPSNAGNVMVSSCGVGLKSGEKYYFFGKYVAPNVYETSQCSCTIRLM